jgi:hypothetical protein
VLSRDPAITDAPAPFDVDGLLTFIASVVELQMLDDLTERDSDMVSMVLLVDFHRGPNRIAWRLHDWLSGDRGDHYRREDNVWVIASVFAAALKVMTDTLANAGGNQE